MELLRKMLRGAGSLPDREDWTKLRVHACESHTEIGDVSFTWDEIDAVKAYKIDLVTTDEIRLLVGFSSPEKLVELSEEQEGFEALSESLNEDSLFPKDGGTGWSNLPLRHVKPRCFSVKHIARFGSTADVH